MIDKEVTISALRSAKVDDLERAIAFWGHLTPEELARPHGESGKTKQELLDGWKRHRETINSAIRWVESL